ncbi:MAG: bifunctional D-glycero-beta-D-manno-heptose-7-phosphate kinase/D-glycero-beta-D-manno-heptose 1-phosphate adenylyltransferase HldE [Thiotrichales bacterium]|nr:bifunctional D-glycero-beta-D-manno-heptose-7-phosphate kinase/D-glycero-beta-D-manno-heptose 1-phosphate adenylyltransferase HldE [Thiotrichales bacterium]
MQFDFSNAKILVVGDVMLDQYWSGSTGRVSPEAPVPVVAIEQQQQRLGGAANVALNLKMLGAQVSLCAVRGADEAGEQLQQLLQQQQIPAHFVISSAPTIRKLRVLSRHQQLLRLDFEQPLPESAGQDMLQWVLEHLVDYDLVVFSDYAKGTLQQITPMLQAAQRLGIPSLVDPKGSCYDKYQGATLIKPNMAEFAQIVGASQNEEHFHQQAQALLTQLNLAHLLITRSEKGMALFSRDQSPYLLPTQAQEVFDVTGAGDTVMATLAAAMANGYALPEAVFLANLAAGIVVAKVGTATVTHAELNDKFSQKQRHQGYVAPSEAQLKVLISQAQQQNLKVVLTNGCFDLLHSGHVRYLDEASKLGDRLVVAVNSDASVQALKGPSRPVVPLQNRMELLAALSCVDWVIPFSEATPERLICELGPDVLVKGGDYQPQQIAGANCVWAKGGEVKVLHFWEGFSTSKIIQRIEGSLNDVQSTKQSS